MSFAKDVRFLLHLERTRLEKFNHFIHPVQHPRSAWKQPSERRNYMLIVGPFITIKGKKLETVHIIEIREPLILGGFSSCQLLCEET